MNQLKNYDLKHVAFHILVGLYFIWMLVFCVLLVLATNNAYTKADPQLSRVLLVWVSLNFVMGTSIFMVLRLFKNRTFTTKIIGYTFAFMATAAVFSVFFIIGKI